MDKYMVTPGEIHDEMLGQRQAGRRHHTPTEDSFQYDLLRAGDPAAAGEHIRMLRSGLPGRVSDNPLHNYKYLTVASATLACRAAIDAGLDPERAYTISDLYLRRVDAIQSLEELLALNEDMFLFYTGEVAALHDTPAYSRPVALCLEYICKNHREKLYVRDIAARLGVTSGYLSTLFHRETGIPLAHYIMEKKVAAACQMLRETSFSSLEISEWLSFSSQSHFIRIFKKHMGMTPQQYRDKK